MRMTQRLEDFGSDVRFALRQMRGSPGFALVAVLTLALGIGANSAMFALADATVLRPLPYPEPDRLVMVWERSPTAGRTPVGPVNLRDVQERNRSFESTATIASNLGGGPLLEAPDGRVESVERQFVSAKFFDVLGVTPVAGRTFLSADEGPAPTAVVLSEGLWRTRFGGDPTLIGREIRLNGRPQTVVGVVSDRVKFSRPASVWSLLPPLPAGFNQRGLRFLEVVGRLKRDVTLESAQADVSVIAGQLAREFPGTNKDWGMTLEPLRTGHHGLGAAAHLTPSLRRRRLRPVDVLRQRGQPAARPRECPGARARSTVSAGRGPGPHCRPASDRELDACFSWRRARCRHRGGDHEAGARLDTARIAARCCRAHLRWPCRGVLRGHRIGRRPVVRSPACVAGDEHVAGPGDRVRQPLGDARRGASPECARRRTSRRRRPPAVRRRAAAADVAGARQLRQRIPRRE